MNETLFVTRADHDETTAYLFYYAGLVIKEAEDRGIPVIDIQKQQLTRQNVTKRIRDQDPIYVFLNGHGSEDAVYGNGQTGEAIIARGVNHAILNGRLVYAVACSAACSLGAACSGGCFIGYRAPFKFFIDQEWAATPHKDKTAALFLGPSNMVASSLLKGNSAEEAIQKFREASRRNMLRLLRSEGEPGAMTSMAVLWENMQGLIAVGQRNMRFQQ